jgi:hypothetical protein
MFIFKASLAKEDFFEAKSALNSSSQYLLKVKAENVKNYFKNIDLFNNQYLTYFKEEILYLENLTDMSSIMKTSFVLEIFSSNINQKL